MCTLDELRTKPEDVLKKNILTCCVGSGCSGKTRADFYDVDNLGLKYLNILANCPINPKDAKRPSEPFDVCVIPVSCIEDETSEVTWVMLDNNVSVMTTTQLSGCSFVVKREDNNLYACHIYNKKNIDRYRRDKLALDYDSNTSYLLVMQGVGLHRYEQYASVIGVRTGSQWRVYVQKQEILEGSSEKKIAGVEAIFFT